MVEQSGELHLLIFPCCFPHARQSLGHALPALSRVRVRLTCVLLDRRPFLLTLRQRSSVFVRMIHRYYTVLLPGLAAGVSEVSRFSCMKLLGASGVFDYAGLSRNSR